MNFPFERWCSLCKCFTSQERHSFSEKHLRNHFNSDKIIQPIQSVHHVENRSYYLKNPITFIFELDRYLYYSKELMIRIVSGCLDEGEYFTLEVIVQFDYTNHKSSEEKHMIILSTENIPLHLTFNIDEEFNKIICNLLQKHGEFGKKFPGWVLQQILGCELKIKFD